MGGGDLLKQRSHGLIIQPGREAGFISLGMLPEASTSSLGATLRFPGGLVGTLEMSRQMIARQYRDPDPQPGLRRAVCLNIFRTSSSSFQADSIQTDARARCSQNRTQ